MANDPILHLLGLAKKAGRLEIGEEPVGSACRARQARLVLLAADAASNTYRRAAHFGEAGNVLWLELPFTKEELGFQLGRSSCAMLALTDAGFAAAVSEKLRARDPEKYEAAASQLRQKADKVLRRQKEQRQHEKNLREGKGKKHPWAPPPVKQEGEEPTSHSKGAKGRAPSKGAKIPARRPKAAQAERPGEHTPGPGRRRLTGKFRKP